MPLVRLKIDISGTVGDAVWREIQHYDEALATRFGSTLGGSHCRHAADAPHPAGEWWPAEVTLSTPLLAQYAVSHYLEQPRVLDADVEP